MTTKTPEELQREREEAQKQLEQMLSASRPKGLKEGLTSGTSNIVQGAVGAAGIAVIAPTMGLAVGLQRGGLVGGALGVAGGAVIGVVGAAAMAVGGAVSGVMQIGRGIVATPESLMAPRQGKWWNEYEGKWVKTDLPKEQESVLKGVPDDDSDLLSKVAEEIDQSIRSDDSAEVKDMAYYDALEVPASAEPSAIKRKYYLLARKYHPDKVGADNKEAADKFKEIAEAYQVLSDAELRAKYDKEGKDGLSADKTSAAINPNIDPALLFAFLFGSDQFKNYVGRLSTATSASVGDSPKVSVADARILQKRRVTRLALKLVEKIQPWIDQKRSMGEATGSSTPTIEEEWKNEAVALSKTSYGYPLVTTIGKVYNMLAIMFEGSVDSGIGLPSLSKWAARQQATLEKKKTLQQTQMDQLKAGLDMMKLKAELDQKMAAATTEEEKEALAKQAQEDVQAILLRVMWTTTVVDITSAIHETTKMVFFDQSVDKETQKLRATAVKALGQIWMDCPAPEGDDSKTSAQLYEEAAFAAMVETMHRKDEEAYK